jgi:hypothetical protein
MDRFVALMHQLTSEILPNSPKPSNNDCDVDKTPRPQTQRDFFKEILNFSIERIHSVPMTER